MRTVSRRVLWLVALLVMVTAISAASAAFALTTGLLPDRPHQPTSTPPPTSTPEPIPPPVIETTSLPDGNVGAQYDVFITSNGGQGTPHMWSLIAGTLPDGLQMASFYGVQSTIIYGKATHVQTTSFTVQVRDGTGHVATRSFTITIDPPLPLVINNDGSTLAPGTVGASYAQSLFVSGGVQPYRWAIGPGQLPPGLTLNGNVISGTPTTRGTFTFTATVTDSQGAQASRQFSIAVS